jgi:hypothetical protein
MLNWSKNIPFMSKAVALLVLDRIWLQVRNGIVYC